MSSHASRARAGLAPVARHQHRTADLDVTVVAHANPRAGERRAGAQSRRIEALVVRHGGHLRARFGEPVARQHRHAAGERARDEARARRRTAEHDRAQRLRRLPFRVRIEHAREHRRHERQQRHARGGEQLRKPRRIEARRERHAAPRNEAAREDRESADMRERHAQQPAIPVVPAEIGFARRSRGEERIAPEDRGPRRAGRPGRVQDRRRMRVDQGSCARGGVEQCAALGRREARMEQECRHAQLEQRVERDHRLEVVAPDERERAALAHGSQQRHAPACVVRARSGAARGLQRRHALARHRCKLAEGQRAAVEDKAGARARIACGGEDRKRVGHRDG